MLDLIIDTSTATCSVSLFNDDKLLSSYHEFIGRGHAEILIPEIANVLDGKIPDHIYVNVGPGSFTGIRIGISAARALGYAWSLPCTGYSAMHLMAAHAMIAIKSNQERGSESNENIAIDVIMNGGHGEFYTQCFDENIRAITALQSLTPEQCLVQCCGDYKTGDKALDVENDSEFLDVTEPDTRLFKQIFPLQSMTMQPLYVRQPDAQKSS